MTLTIAWAQEALPEFDRPSIFLAGPTYRDRTERCSQCRGEGSYMQNHGDMHDTECAACKGKGHKELVSWRAEALTLLRTFDGIVVVPEMPAFGVFNDDAEAQVRWEHEALSRVDVIAFWIPRDMKLLPGLATNVEFGYYLACKAHGRRNAAHVVLGYPPDAPKTRYLALKAELVLGHALPVESTLDKTLNRAVMLTLAAPRTRRDPG